MTKCFSILMRHREEVKYTYNPKAAIPTPKPQKSHQLNRVKLQERKDTNLPQRKHYANASSNTSVNFSRLLRGNVTLTCPLLARLALPLTLGLRCTFKDLDECTVFFPPIASCFLPLAAPFFETGSVLPPFAPFLVGCRPAIVADLFLPLPFAPLLKKSSSVSLSLSVSLFLLRSLLLC